MIVSTSETPKCRIGSLDLTKQENYSLKVYFLAFEVIVVVVEKDLIVA